MNRPGMNRPGMAWGSGYRAGHTGHTGGGYGLSRAMRRLDSYKFNRPYRWHKALGVDWYKGGPQKSGKMNRKKIRTVYTGLDTYSQPVWGLCSDRAHDTYKSGQGVLVIPARA